MEAQSLGDMLRRTVLRLPKKVAMLVPAKDGFSEVRYEQLLEHVRDYAAALSDLGIRRGEKVCLLSENGIEWALTDWACQCLGIVLVPIYSTLPGDQAEYIVRDCEAVLVVCGTQDQLGKVECIEGVQKILLKGPGSLEEKAKAVDRGMSWLNQEIDLTQPEDLATIIYTSGTTGLPKGAMMPHRAFVHVCESARKLVPLRESDTFLTFLPMSHVYERVAGQCLPVCLGATIAYSKSLASLSGDMQKVKPTIMLCVPRFLESIRDRALDNVAKQSPIKQKLFHLAISQGVKKANGRFAPFASILDKIVMGKLRERVGGKMRYFVSGGAALAPHVAEFYIGSGLEVLQGYGLTETSGGTCLNRPEQNKYWTVGLPLDMELKIADDGEILIKGPALMLGYYNLPEETNKAIDKDGWFHSGDIGEFEGPYLKITDRKKDLLVLGNGKNVAPQPIENRLKSSAYISEVVVLGDGMDHCVALVVPNFEAVRTAFKLDSAANLSSNPDVRTLLKKEIDRVNKTLAPFEAVKKFSILDAPFSLEAGELTPTNKIKRKVVVERHADKIREMTH
jgi:long-chain acyl-CoA synthetase